MKKFFLIFSLFSTILFPQKSIISVFEPSNINQPFEGDVTVYFSPLTIESKVSGTVYVVGGTCHLKEKAEVNDITILFGSLKVDKGAVIKGKKIIIAPVEERESNIKNKIGLSLFWLFWAFLLIFIFPYQIASSIFIFKNNIKKTIIIGFLGFAIFFLLFSLFFLFTSLYMGYPLILVLIAFFFLSKAYGTIVLFWIFGNKIGKKFGKVASLFLGWLIFSLIRLIPYAGEIFWGFITFISIGIVLVHLGQRYKSQELKF